MDFSIQEPLENEWVALRPLKATDFEALYAVASDPAVWANHPNKNRCERAVFENFFKGALESGGAYLIFDQKSGELAGSSRFYNYQADDNSLFIGYTFYATRYWGKGLNAAAKKLMLAYIFQFVDQVYFHVGAENHRSIRAMEKLGAQKVREVVVAYFGEPDRLNVEFLIEKKDFPMD